MDQFSYDPLTALSADDFASQRAGARDSLMLAAQFRVAGGTAEQVRVRNLSAGGLMAEYAQPVERGTQVEVEVRGVGWVSGRIAWSAEGRPGRSRIRQLDRSDARAQAGGPGQAYAELHQADHHAALIIHRFFAVGVRPGHTP